MASDPAERKPLERNHVSKHARFGPQRQSRGILWLWHATKDLPWERKAKRRRQRKQRNATRKSQR